MRRLLNSLRQQPSRPPSELLELLELLVSETETLRRAVEILEPHLEPHPRDQIRGLLARQMLLEDD